MSTGDSDAILGFEMLPYCVIFNEYVINSRNITDLPPINRSGYNENKPDNDPHPVSRPFCQQLFEYVNLFWTISRSRSSLFILDLARAANSAGVVFSSELCGRSSL